MKELVEKRCKRAIAIVLSSTEKEHLDPAAYGRVRKVVMDQFNDFAALVTDVLESATQDVIYNDLWVERLEAIHSDLQDLKAVNGISDRD